MSSTPQHPHHPLTLATKVTILRILGVPVFISLMIYYKEGLEIGQANVWYRYAALVMFMLVALTDALDGYLARSRNEFSRLGAILDPIADKALVLSGLILFTRPSLPQLQPQYPIWFTVLVITKDVVSVLGAYLVHHVAGNVDIRARWSGKISTALMMLSLVWALSGLAPGQFVWIVNITALFALIAGFQYLIDGVRQFERTHHLLHHPEHPPHES